MRSLTLVAVFAITAAAGEPVPATMVEINDTSRTISEHAGILTKQSQIPIDVSKIDSSKKFGLPRIPRVPFWVALEMLCAAGKTGISLDATGKSIRMTSERNTVVSSVDGPFRIAVKGVTARNDLELGKTFYDVSLLIHWEPRFPVFRIDSVPSINEAKDDRGTVLTCMAAKTKTPVGDAFATTLTFRLDGLTRESKSIALLKGKFNVTASAKMLAFTFDDFTKLPVAKSDSNVNVTLTKFAPVSGRWDAEFKLQYPEDHPEFESFESWLDNNTLKLVSPDRTKSFAPENFSTSGHGRKLIAEYRFLKAPMTDAKGWTLTYQTPAPLTEYSVKFELKSIPLP